MTIGNENLTRILTAPDEVSRHAEIRSQLDAAGVDRPRYLHEREAAQVAAGQMDPSEATVSVRLPPLVAGGQGRDGDEVRRHAWTVVLLIALSAIVLAAAVLGGVL